MINFLKKHWTTIFLVLFSLLPLVWFVGKGNAIINGVDTNFPLDPALWLYRRFYMWNNLGNGGSDFSFAPAGIFFHIVQYIPYIIGFPLQVTQKISLVFWFGLIAFSAYIYSDNLVKNNRLLRILFVCLYSLNIYMFNSWENVKVSNLSLVAAIPLLLHIFIKLKDGLLSYTKAGLYLVFVSLVLSGAGINPAYFITAISVLVIFALASIISGESFKKVSKPLVFIVSIIFVISSYWIIPTISFVFRSISQNSSIGSIGFNNWVDSLSVNTNILNIIRLQGAWDWYIFDGISKLPIYLPYVVNYFYKFPFIIFSFFIPSIVLISLIYINKTKISFYISFAIMLALGIFLGSGTHEPTGVFFKWLIENLPYFSLFRSPWYIFTPFLTLSLAGLTVLFLGRFNGLKTKIVVIILILGNLLYTYPILTGKIFRPNKSDGFFVNFPNYLFEATKYLSNSTSGRVITYPDDQLEKFKWGYVGVEPVIGLLIDKETLFSGINNTGTEINKIIQLLYENIRRGSFGSVLNLADKLNATSILEKKDQYTLSPDFIYPLNQFKQKSFGDWKIHTLRENNDDFQKIFIGNNFYYQNISSNDYSTKALTILTKDKHLLNEKDDVINKIFPSKIPVGKIIVANNSQKDSYLKLQKLPNITLNKLTSQNITEVKYTFNVTENGYYSPVIESYDIPSSLTELNVTHNSINEKWSIKKITDSHIYINNIYLSVGKHEIIYKTPNNLVLSEDFENKVDFEAKTHRNDKAEITIVESRDNKQLSLLNRGNVDISADFQVTDFDYNSPYFVQLDYEWSHGNMSTVYVNQKKNDSYIKTQIESLPSYLNRTNFNFYYEPVKTDSTMSVSLAAPYINNSLGTQVSYDNLKVYKLFMNDLFFVQDPDVLIAKPIIKTKKLSPVEYNGEVQNVSLAHALIFAENYSPEWKIKITGLDGKKIPFRIEHFTVDSYANAWFVNTNSLDYKFEIYYQPQIYFYVGVILSGLSVLLIIFIYAKNSKRN